MPSQNRSQAKSEIGDFVVNEILRFVGSGKSPVAGEKASFPKLDKNYAEDKKGGNTTANLDLQGDMLDALTFKNVAGGIEIGIFGDEAPKADGHNNHSGESSLPRRRFIPDEDQKFRGRIESGVKKIIKEFETGSESGLDIVDRITGVGPKASNTTAVTLRDIIGPSIFDDLFEVE